MLEQFSATIDKIYATAGDFQRWHDALQAIEALTGSAGAVIDMVPRSTTFAAKTIAGSFGLTECATYARDYMAICPRIRFALEHPQGPHYDHLLLTEAEMDRDPVYAWFGSYGLRYYIGAWAGQTPNYRATFSLQRSRKQGHATEADMAMFNLLKPHAARALSLADQLGTLHSRERVGSSLVESLTQAVLAIARDGRIVHANDAAMRVLGTGDGLLVSKGFLRTQIPDEQARLDQLIREAIDVEILATSGWCKASRVSGALPYAIFVAPLHTDDETFLATAKALVIVHDLRTRRAPDPRMLSQVYGLTDTEARLASAIAVGHSLESAGATLQMRVGTARSHLKSIFVKLRVNRQQDLVRQLTSLSSLLE